MNVRFSFFYGVILTRAEISENYGWFDRHSTDVSIVQWPKLHLGLDALRNQKILKRIYYSNTVSK